MISNSKLRYYYERKYRIKDILSISIYLSHFLTSFVWFRDKILEKREIVLYFIDITWDRNTYGELVTVAIQ